MANTRKQTEPPKASYPLTPAMTPTREYVERAIHLCHGYTDERDVMNMVNWYFVPGSIDTDEEAEITRVALELQRLDTEREEAVRRAREEAIAGLIEVAESEIKTFELVRGHSRTSKEEWDEAGQGIRQRQLAIDWLRSLTSTQGVTNV